MGYLQRSKAVKIDTDTVMLIMIAITVWEPESFVCDTEVTLGRVGAVPLRVVDGIEGENELEGGSTVWIEVPRVDDG